MRPIVSGLCVGRARKRLESNRTRRSCVSVPFTYRCYVYLTIESCEVRRCELTAVTAERDPRRRGVDKVDGIGRVSGHGEEEARPLERGGAFVGGEPEPEARAAGKQAEQLAHV